MVEQVAGSLVLERAFCPLNNVDATVGQPLEDKLRAGNAPEPTERMDEG